MARDNNNEAFIARAVGKGDRDVNRFGCPKDHSDGTMIVAGLPPDLELFLPLEIIPEHRCLI